MIQESALCEICHGPMGPQGIMEFYHGGKRPSRAYRPQTCRMCEDCQRALAPITGEIRFRKDSYRDTTNSRFTILQRALKESRFGNPQFPTKSKWKDANESLSNEP
jgi:hypothetical protein